MKVYTVTAYLVELVKSGSWKVQARSNVAPEQSAASGTFYLNVPVLPGAKFDLTLDDDRFAVDLPVTQDTHPHTTTESFTYTMQFRPPSKGEWYVTSVGSKELFTDVALVDHDGPRLVITDVRST